MTATGEDPEMVVQQSSVKDTVMNPAPQINEDGEVIAVDRLVREALAFLLLNIPLRDEAWVQDEPARLVAKLRLSVRAESKSSTLGQSRVFGE